MGRHLDIIRRFEAEPRQEGLRPNDQNDQRGVQKEDEGDFGRLCRLCRTPTALTKTLEVLEQRCPDHVPVDSWRQAIEDGRRFLIRWGDQAERLGWTARDLFGLFPVPENPHPSFSRLSRYDHTGLVWLLRGRSVTALTKTGAAIENPTGTITIYRKEKRS